MADAGAELGVVVAYGRIIPVSVLDRLPMVNVHFSLLPRWRGAAPVERAILEGDAETGVCLMAVEAGLDTGGIYAELDTDIGEEETADELRARLVIMGCQLLVEHLGHGLAGLPVPRDQMGEPSYAEKILAGRTRAAMGPARAPDPEGDPAGSGMDHVPRPAARHPPGRPVRRAVRGSAPGSRRARSTAPRWSPPTGTRVRLVTVQPEGKRPMDADDWLRGVRPQPGERLGS